MKQPTRSTGKFRPDLSCDGEQPGGEQQRVAGQEEADQQARLGEDDEEQPDRGERAQPVDDLLGIEEVERGEQVRHGGTIDHAPTEAWPRDAARLDRSGTARDGRTEEGVAATVPGRVADQTDPARPRSPVAKPLVIVESPAKARTIAGYLGRRLHGAWRASATSATCRANKKECRPQHPTRSRPTAASPASTPTTTSTSSTSCTRSKKKVVTELKRALKGADELILATDEDREGEAIGWHVLEVLKPKVPVKRMVFHEITPHAIREALDTAARARHEARRGAGGAGASSTASSGGRPRRSCGGCSAAARPRRPGGCRASRCGMVVERERARMRFRSGAWHDLEGTFLAASDASSAVRRRARRARRTPARRRPRLRSRDRPARRRPRRRAARRRRGRRRSPTACATFRSGSRASTPTRSPNSRARRSRRRRCNRSRAASCGSRRRARWRSPSGCTSTGYITYMRTDSTNLSEQAITAARTAIRQQYGDDYLPDEPRTYRSKVKNAQEAHEAIRPAGDEIRTPDAVRGELDGDEQRLYELIWMRTIACQMVDARGRKVTIRLGGDVDRRRARRRSAPRARPTTSSAGGARTSKTSTRTTRSSAKRGLPSVHRRRRVDVHASSTAGRPRDEAARALHRSEPRQGARGARHRPAVDVRGGDRDDPGARLRVAQGHRARARRGPRSRSRTCSSNTSATSSTTASPRRWKRRSTSSRAARAKREKWLDSFYFGNGTPGLRELVSDEHLATHRPRGVSTIPIGIDDTGHEIVVRVGRYGPYVQREDERDRVASARDRARRADRRASRSS